MACCTLVIFSASSSGISVSNSSSSAITSSTVSSESAPRSSTNDDSFLISASLTPSCSATIFLTRCSMFSILFSFPFWPRSGPMRAAILPESGHVHPAVDVQHAARDVAGGGRREEAHRGGDFLGAAEAPQRDLPQQ